MAALAGEARNARDVCARVTLQRKALRAERGQIVAQLAKIREVGELKHMTINLVERYIFNQ